MIEKFNQYDRNENPDWDPDVLADFYLFPLSESERKFQCLNGYRPVHKVKEDYLTTGQHFYLETGKVEPGSSQKTFIKFITPEAYPNSLWIGRIIDVQESSKIIGRATILEIYNKILELNVKKQD